MATNVPSSTPFEDRVFLGFVAASTLAMAWIAAPFLSGILWAVIAAVMFAPINDRLMLRMPARRNTAAALTLLLVIGVVIVPAFTVGSLLVDQVLETYQQIQSRQLDINKFFDSVRDAVPPSIERYIDRYGLDDLRGLQERLSSILTSGLRLAVGQAVSVGQSAFGFAMTMGVMLYLTYFLLRDGRALTRTIGAAIPLQPERKAALFDKFTTVIRATIKGSIVVAAVQGLLGGLTFWMLGIGGALLWGVVMALLSLVPAIGAGLIWVPVAVYLLASGAVWQGVVLIAVGVFVIGMADNVLRPILVGADTRMPDYIVLISTLGGIAAMGINGFIVGPIIAAMFIAAWGIFAESRAEA